MRKRIPHRFIRIDGENIEQKWCKKCETWKSLEEFNNKKASYDGKETQCKECTRMKSKDFRQKNPNYDKEYQKKHYEKLKKYKRNYYIKRVKEKSQK